MAGLKPLHFAAPHIATPPVSRAALAWTIAVVEVVLMLQAIALWMSWGVRFAAEFAIPGLIALALVGALILSRKPNRFGWYLVLMPVPGLIAYLCSEYSDLVTIAHVPLPAEPFVTWVGNWIWTPSLGVGISMLALRFPDGHVLPGWRVVDVVAIAGTSILTAAVAWITAVGGSPTTVTPVQALMLVVGLGIIALGAVGALASMLVRYRHGGRELRLQMKWMLLAMIVLTVALVFAAVLEATYAASFGIALVPFFIALICVPIAIGVAILRYRLFDIDLIISRTLVYVMITGILGGLYIGMIELMQQVSILYTGQRSETAIVLTAFVVAGAFRPVEKWTDHVVERRFRRGDVAARLQAASASAESMVRVIDPDGFAQWLLDEAVTAFEADGGVLYLYGYHRSHPFHSHGRIHGDTVLEIAVHHGGHDLGRLVLGPRRGGVDYSHRDVEALKRSGAALGAALSLASDLGHIARTPVTAAAASDGGERAPTTAVPAVASEPG